MGGSSSQPRTDPALSLINAFPVEELYTPEFLDSLQDNIGQESGVGDTDYVQREMIHYEIETGLPFKLRHCWEILIDHPKWQEIAIPNFNTGSEGGSKRHKSSGSSSFSTESGKASINLNTTVGDNDEDEVQEIRRSEGKDKARGAERKNKGSKSAGSSNVNEDVLAREVECRERELEQQDMRFYLHPYDHLTGDQRKAMDKIKAKIKAKYNLQY
ncbi:gamma-glutamyltranspeptidase 1 [Tanacetum coccineum]